MLVVRNTLTGFSILTEYYPEVFMENKEISKIFQHFLHMAKSKDEIIKNGCLTSLCNITDILDKYPDPIATDPKDYMQ